MSFLVVLRVQGCQFWGVLEVFLEGVQERTFRGRSRGMFLSYHLSLIIDLAGYDRGLRSWPGGPQKGLKMRILQEVVESLLDRNGSSRNL